MISKKTRRPVLQRLGEDLQHVAHVVAVDEDPQLAQRFDRLVDLTDALLEHLVVRIGRVEKLDAVGA